MRSQVRSLSRPPSPSTFLEIAIATKLIRTAACQVKSRMRQKTKSRSSSRTRSRNDTAIFVATLQKTNSSLRDCGVRNLRCERGPGSADAFGLYAHWNSPDKRIEDRGELRAQRAEFAELFFGDIRFDAQRH